MNYLGLDLGSKTVGVSISTSGIIANNLTTIRFTENNYDEASLEVIKLVKSNKIDVLVIGVPRHKNHDLGNRGQISVDFKDTIKRKNKISKTKKTKRWISCNANLAKLLRFYK